MEGHVITLLSGATTGPGPPLGSRSATMARPSPGHLHRSSMPGPLPCGRSLVVQKAECLVVQRAECLKHAAAGRAGHAQGAHPTGAAAGGRGGRSTRCTARDRRAPPGHPGSPCGILERGEGGRRKCMCRCVGVGGQGRGNVYSVHGAWGADSGAGRRLDQPQAEVRSGATAARLQGTQPANADAPIQLPYIALSHGQLARPRQPGPPRRLPGEPGAPTTRAQSGWYAVKHDSHWILAPMRCRHTLHNRSQRSRGMARTPSTGS